MIMNGKHKNFKLKEFNYKPKYTQDDIDMIKSMKADGKDYADIYYEMLKRFTDPSTKVLRVSPQSMARWIKEN